MERLMILLAVVAVSLSTVLSCPHDYAAMSKELEMCTYAMAPAGQTKESQCLYVTNLMKCMTTVLTGCEGVPYVEADRAEIDATIQSFNTISQELCD
ncbi:hypothetical protein V1264_004296 [Littorina saxatilis]|uniref:Uncharacterized protein n=1 Tax=Littorina saxatilis TaxID=31220 RepID=A0AAN9G797_9CAEN